MSIDHTRLTKAVGISLEFIIQITPMSFYGSICLEITGVSPYISRHAILARKRDERERERARESIVTDAMQTGYAERFLRDGFRQSILFT